MSAWEADALPLGDTRMDVAMRHREIIALSPLRTRKKQRYMRYFVAPIRQIVVPQSGHVPFVMGLPFFVVLSTGFCMTFFALHFTQYASIAIVTSKNASPTIPRIPMPRSGCPIIAHEATKRGHGAQPLLARHAKRGRAFDAAPSWARCSSKARPPYRRCDRGRRHRCSR